MEIDFKIGDVVVLKSSPYLNLMTIEAINSDGSLLCVWSQYFKTRNKEGRELKRESFNPELLQYPPLRRTILR
jgi:uncharacterized protein YodC (DUF2158 family)